MQHETQISLPGEAPISGNSYHIEHTARNNDLCYQYHPLPIWQALLDAFPFYYQITSQYAPSALPDLRRMAEILGWQGMLIYHWLPRGGYGLRVGLRNPEFGWMCLEPSWLHPDIRWEDDLGAYCHAVDTIQTALRGLIGAGEGYHLGLRLRRLARVIDAHVGAGACPSATSPRSGAAPEGGQSHGAGVSPSAAGVSTFGASFDEPVGYRLANFDHVWAVCPVWVPSPGPLQVPRAVMEAWVECFRDPARLTAALQGSVGRALRGQGWASLCKYWSSPQDHGVLPTFGLEAPHLPGLTFHALTGCFPQHVDGVEALIAQLARKARSLCQDMRPNDMKAYLYVRRALTILLMPGPRYGAIWRAASALLLRLTQGLEGQAA